MTFDKTYYFGTVGEEIKITPKFNIDIPENTTRYKFQWRIDSDVRPEWSTREFNWIADNSYNRSNLVLEVTDKNNGMVYMNSISISVSGFFETDYSWMILSEEPGTRKSILSYFSCLEYGTDEIVDVFKSTKFYKNVYADANDNTELGIGPIAIQEHFRISIDYFEEVIGNVCIFQESGAVDLTGVDMKKDINLIQAFDGGAYPIGSIIYPGSFMDRVDVVSDQNGKLYSRIKASPKVYHSEYFLHRPLKCEGETEELEKCIVARGYYRSNRTGFAPIYDGKNKRMLYIKNSDDEDINDGGAIYAMAAKGVDNSDDDIFIPLDNMKGYTLISMDMCGKGYPNYGLNMVLQKDGTNEFYHQIIIFSGGWYPFKVVKVEMKPIIGLAKTPTIATFPCYNNVEYGFFAVDNTVYYFDIASGDSVQPYYTFDAPITAMSAQTDIYSNKHMAVGLENGEFHILLISGAKNLEQSKRLLYTSPEKVGKIVDLQYKCIDHWNY